MKKVNDKKPFRLALRRETVAQLTIKQLKEAAGGEEDSGGVFSCVATICTEG
jgi:hypothetical protein